MAELVQVTPSGSIGKQTYAATVPKVLEHVYVDAPISAATLTIRDGNASGDVRLKMTVPVAVGFNDAEVECVRFDRGMHVKVTGVGAAAYLLIK